MNNLEDQESPIGAGGGGGVVGVLMSMTNNETK